MFRLEYGILSNERKRLMQVGNLALFEKELDEVEGQIHITCNQNEIGFVDETIPYEGEYLVTWLNALNKGILYLENNGYFAMLIPDSADVWLEFKLQREVVCISEVQVEKKYKEFTMLSPIESTKIFWSDRIEKEELFQEILKKTDNFLQDVYSINQLLVDSKGMKKLINSFEMSKAVLGNHLNQG